MLDLIWNLFQDDDIKRLRSGVASREVQGDALRGQGEADGKVDLMNELIECSDCGRFLLNTAIVCPYCGASNTSGNAFDMA